MYAVGGTMLHGRLGPTRVATFTNKSLSNDTGVLHDSTSLVTSSIVQPQLQ